MFVDVRQIMTTSLIAPSDKLYFVVRGVPGIDLHIGDPVIMREVGIDNVLVRTTDMTVHRLSNADGEYVLVVPPSAVRPE